MSRSALPTGQGEPAVIPSWLYPYSHYGEMTASEKQVIRTVYLYCFLVELFPYILLLIGSPLKDIFF